MQISGQTMIFRNEHESREGTWYTYTTGVSSKKQDGTYVNAYMPVRFKKGIVVDNKSKIDIKNGFFTVREYTTSGGELRKVIEMMITEFDIVEGGAGHTGVSEHYTALTDDDVPF